MNTQSSQRPYPPPYDHTMMELVKARSLAINLGASSALTAALDRVLDLSQRRHDLAADSTSKSSEGCARLLAEAKCHDWEGAFDQGKLLSRLSPIFTSGSLQGQFLKSFVSIQRAKRVLEIGMFTGTGALAMAEGLPADGQVVTIDIEPYLEQLVRPLLDQCPHGNKVNIVIGDAIQKMRELCEAGEHFDLVFIDSNVPMFKECLKICFDKNLLAPNGTVLVDNSFEYGAAYKGDGTNSFLDYVSAQKHLHKVVIPMRDGVCLIRRLSEVEGNVRDC